MSTPPTFPSTVRARPADGAVDPAPSTEARHEQGGFGVGPLIVPCARLHRNDGGVHPSSRTQARAVGPAQYCRPAHWGGGCSPTDPRHGLVARSGWEQEEARTVLRDLGWVWEEELHALVQPDDVSAVEAGVQAVEELHLHGHCTGFSTAPYGAMPLTPNRVESIITKEGGTRHRQVTPGRSATPPPGGRTPPGLE